MISLIKQILTGKSTAVNGLIALGIVSVIAMGCTCGKDFMNKASNSNSTTSNTAATPAATATPDKDTLSDEPRGEVPSEKELEELVKATLLDFNSAVQQGDFTDFHSKISDVWKKQASPEKFNQGFSEFITKKIDISDVRNKNAEFSPEPTVTKKSGYKILTAKGRYETVPLPTKFETEYLKEDGEWKLFSIRVDTRK